MRFGAPPPRAHFRSLQATACGREWSLGSRGVPGAHDREAPMVQDGAGGVLGDAAPLAAAAHVTCRHMVQLVAHLRACARTCRRVKQHCLIPVSNVNIPLCCAGLPFMKCRHADTVLHMWQRAMGAHGMHAHARANTASRPSFSHPCDHCRHVSADDRVPHCPGSVLCTRPGEGE